MENRGGFEKINIVRLFFHVQSAPSCHGPSRRSRYSDSWHSISRTSMIYGGMKVRLLGVVVGAATVESLSLSARSSIRMLSTSSSSMSMVAGSGIDSGRYADFIKDKVRGILYYTHVCCATICQSDICAIVHYRHAIIATTTRVCESLFVSSQHVVCHTL